MTSKTFAPYCSHSIISRLGSENCDVAQDVRPDLGQLGLDRRRLHDRRAEDLEQVGRDLARALADAADDARQRVDLLEEAPGGDPLGHVGDEDVLADGQVAVLLEVAGDELGRARGDRRAQRDRVAGRAAAASRSSSALRMSRMSISMCENDGVPSVMTMWRAEAASATRSDHAIVPAAVTRSSDLRRAGLVERHPRRAHRVEPLAVDLDADRPQPPVGEGERERQPDATAADDGHVVFHARRQASDASPSLYHPPSHAPRPHHRHHRPGRLVPRRAAARRRATRSTASSAARRRFNTERIDHLYRDPHEEGVQLFLHYGDLTESTPARAAGRTRSQPDEIYHLGAQSPRARLLRHARVHGRRHRHGHAAPARGDPRRRRADALLPGLVERDVRRDAAAAVRDDAVPPAQPVRGREGRRRYWIDGQLPRDATACSPCNGILFNHESAAPRRDVRDAQDHPRAGARSRPACRTSSTSATSTPSATGATRPTTPTRCGGCSRQDEPDDYVDRHRRDALRARVPRRGRARTSASTGRRSSRSTRATCARPRSTRCRATPSKAREQLGWEPTVDFDELVRIMVDADVKRSRTSSPGAAVRRRGERGAARSRRSGAASRSSSPAAPASSARAVRARPRGARRRRARRRARPSTTCATRAAAREARRRRRGRRPPRRQRRRHRLQPPQPGAARLRQPDDGGQRLRAGRARPGVDKLVVGVHGLRLPEVHAGPVLARTTSGTATRRSRTRPTGWRRR